MKNELKKFALKTKVAYGNRLYSASLKVTDHAHRVRKAGLEQRIRLALQQREEAYNRVREEHGEDTANKLAEGFANYTAIHISNN